MNYPGSSRNPKCMWFEVTNDRMLVQELEEAGTTSSELHLHSVTSSLGMEPRLPPTLSPSESLRQHQLAAWLGAEALGVSDAHLTLPFWELESPRQECFPQVLTSASSSELRKVLCYLVHAIYFTCRDSVKTTCPGLHKPWA